MFVDLFLKIYLFIICKYTVAIFRHSRRGGQISLWMVVSHHVVAGIWTRDLWKSSQVLLPTEPSHQPCFAYLSLFIAASSVAQIWLILYNRELLWKLNLDSATQFLKDRPETHSRMCHDWSVNEKEKRPCESVFWGLCPFGGNYKKRGTFLRIYFIDLYGRVDLGRNVLS